MNGASSAGSGSQGVIDAGITSFEMTSGNGTLALLSNNLATNQTNFLAFSNGDIIGWNLGHTTADQYLFLSNYNCGAASGVPCYWLAEDSAYDNTAGRDGNAYVSLTTGNLPTAATTPLLAAWTVTLADLAALGYMGFRQSKNTGKCASA